LPHPMAEVSSLLDLAGPALREALLVALLDLLSCPSRAVPASP
jgi:sphinganine-1-phosphate aldolase